MQQTIPIRSRVAREWWWPVALWTACTVAIAGALFLLAVPSMIVLLFVDPFLVPVGFLLGMVALALRAVRRNRARLDAIDVEPAGGWSPPVQRAIGYAAPAQRFDLIVHGSLLANLLLFCVVGAVQFPKTMSTDADFVPGAILASTILVASIGVPCSLVATGRLAFDRAVLAGEAQALTHRIGAFRRIRLARLVTDVTLALYSAAFLGVLSATLFGRVFG